MVVLPAFVTSMVTSPLATVALPVCAPASEYVSCLSAQVSVAFRDTATPDDDQQSALPVMAVPPPLGVTEKLVISMLTVLFADGYGPSVAVVTGGTVSMTVTGSCALLVVPAASVAV